MEQELFQRVSDDDTDMPGKLETARRLVLSLFGRYLPNFPLMARREAKGGPQSDGLRGRIAGA